MNSSDDIRDDEIRIVGGQTVTHDNRKTYTVIAAVAVALIAVAAALTFIPESSPEEEIPIEGVYENEADSIPVCSKSFVKIESIAVGSDSLRIYTPVYSEVYLSVGPYDFKDSSAVFVCQAADIRKDNHKILGDFVLEGEKLSYGHSKWGWCSIIDNVISLGCEKEPAALQTAIDMHGSFFRQFGLVINGKYVKDTDNRRYRCIRRALCTKNGTVMIAESMSKVSLYTFANILETYGVDNAVALVGNETYGFAVDENRCRTEFGKANPDLIFESTSYIIFK